MRHHQKSQSEGRYQLEEFKERQPEPALTIHIPFLFSYEAEEFKEQRPEPAPTIPFPANKFPKKYQITYLNIHLFVLLSHF